MTAANVEVEEQIIHMWHLCVVHLLHQASLQHMIFIIIMEWSISIKNLALPSP